MPASFFSLRGKNKINSLLRHQGGWQELFTGRIVMKKRIVTGITDFIFVSDEMQRSDVLFLPGGSDPAIPEKAAELYTNGFAPVLVPSGGVSVKTGMFAGVRRKTDIYGDNYKTECAFYADVLLKNGVSKSAIIEEDKSGYTKENALFTRNLLNERGFIIKTAIVICKSFHARRCLMCYQFAFPNAEILICPVDVYEISRDNWYTHEYGVDRVMGELSRCGNQFVSEMKTFGFLKTDSGM